MNIHWQETDIESVIQHFVKDYELPEGQAIFKHEWSINPTTGRVVLKLIIREVAAPADSKEVE